MDGVGREPGVMRSTKESAGFTWVAKISAYWPADVLPSPIIAV